MKNLTLKIAAWAHKAVNPTPSIKKFYQLASYTENPTPAYPLHKLNFQYVDTSSHLMARLFTLLKDIFLLFPLKP